MKPQTESALPSSTNAATFYRELLEQITHDPRKTRGRRLAESGLIFWDQMQKEAAKNAKNQTLKPHQARVVTEKVELDEKRTKLVEFIGTNPTYRTLDSMEQSRLNRQLEAMTLYSQVLGERIAAFK